MASAAKLDEDQVLVERKSYARVLTLNRPKQLNALSYYMLNKSVSGPRNAGVIGDRCLEKIPLLLNGHRGMMFPTGLTITLVTVKVLRMAKDDPHIHILLSLIYKKQSPYTERRHILSSNSSYNTTSNIALVNMFLTVLISIFMIVKPLMMKRDGHHIHITLFQTQKDQCLNIEHLLILTRDKSFLVFRVNQFWHQNLHLLPILPLVVGLTSLLQITVQVSKLLEVLHDDEENSDVKLVIVKGNGRAFCAGGDVAAVAHNAKGGDWRFGAKFFDTEYKLNYLMATYSKPQVSILNGIVMGGGAGASMHGRFRVVTENTVFAMPETALGLFPDVGAPYFLSRLAGFFGEYVGLTGARLDGAEMLACGLATHFVPSTKLSLLEESLCKVETSDPAVVSAIIDKYSKKVSLKEDSVYHRMYVINKCFSRKTMEEILSSLETEATGKADSWISTTLETLKKSSPTSLKIFLRLIREVRLLGIGDCLVREYRIVCHILQGHHSKDFFEGCRAILIDKDRKPKWGPSKLELLSDSDVDRYFSKLDAEGWKDLELPKRFKNLPAHAISKL